MVKRDFKCNCGELFDYGSKEMDEHRKLPHWRGFWIND